MKRIKKIIIGLLMISLIVTGIIFIKNQQTDKTVKVFAVSSFAIEEDWSQQTYYQGTVITNQLQPVYVSSTQIVNEVLVREKQPVKKGDILMTYDSTLSELSIIRKELEMQRHEYDLNRAYNELAVINTYIPGVPIYINTNNSTTFLMEAQVNPKEDPKDEEPKEEFEQLFTNHLGGIGSKEDPFIVLLNDEISIDSQFMETILEEKDVVYAHFNIYSEDDSEDELLQQIQMEFKKNEEGKSLFSILSVLNFVNKDEPPIEEPPIEEPPIEEPPIDLEPEPPTIVYTANEIAKMRNEKEAEIRNLSISLRSAEIELKDLEQEKNNNFVLAQLDGIVTDVISVEEAQLEGKQLFQVSTSGSFIVSSTISELDLESFKIGDKMSIISYENGEYTEGEIISISQYPSQSNDFWGGNSNQSNYPIKLSVDKSANLRNGMWVELNPLVDEEDEPFFALMSAFIRTDEKEPYVWIARDGKLTKQVVKTGRSIYGYYLEITDGSVTIDDLVAFPYGNHLREGLQVLEGSYEDLYME